MPSEIKIALSNFRAFAETGVISIKPLTVLVGENSTGKTSFLAALRFALQLSEGEKPGYFNTYPFDLGSFDDIVHQSGNLSANWRFSITIQKTIDIVRDGSVGFSRDEKPDIRDCTLTIFFCSQYGDVAISSFIFSFDNIELIYNSKLQNRFSMRIGEAQFELDRLEPRLFADGESYRSVDLRRLSYVVFNLYYSSTTQTKDNAELADALRQVVHGFDAFVTSKYNLYTSPPRSVCSAPGVHVFR